MPTVVTSIGDLTTLPSGAAPVAIGYGNGTYVVLAYYASTSETKAHASEDLSTWTTYQFPGTGRVVDKLTFGAGRWIASEGGNGATAYTSTDDGASWSAIGSPIATSFPSFFEYGGGVWVCTDYTDIFISTDGGATFSAASYTGGVSSTEIGSVTGIAYSAAAGKWLLSWFDSGATGLLDGGSDAASWGYGSSVAANRPATLIGAGFGFQLLEDAGPSASDSTTAVRYTSADGTTWSSQSNTVANGRFLGYESSNGYIIGDMRNNRLFSTGALSVRLRASGDVEVFESLTASGLDSLLTYTPSGSDEPYAAFIANDNLFLLQCTTSTTKLVQWLLEPDTSTPPPDPGTDVTGDIAVRGPLGTASARIALTWAKAACAGPLGTPRAIGWHDFTGLIGPQPLRYVADLITPDGPVRVPISSWQATLRAGAGSNYAQCVVPGVNAWVESLQMATEFVVYRTAKLISGRPIEYEMLRAPLTQLTLDQGPSRHTATVSGYFDAFSLADYETTATDRTLVDVRSTSISDGGARVRCAIDWLLRPGFRAFVGEMELDVTYINYYVNADDQYMDVGAYQG